METNHSIIAGGSGKKNKSKIVLIYGAVVLGLLGLIYTLQTAAVVSYPTSPPVQVCGNSSILGNGPTTAPAGAITVPAGNNSGVNFQQAGKTYWFQPGVHTLGTSQYSQIIPGDNAVFIGAPGAILDGQRLNNYAFTQHAQNVTIRYLTIQNFGPVGSNNNEGVVNHDSGHGWTIEYNTIKNNAGAGLFLGSNTTARYNCLADNEQYGFSSYEPDGVSNLNFTLNEISGNNTYDWEAKIDGCGCSGGGKFWEVTGAVVTNNYVHNNKGTGLWADNNNAGFLIEGNYIIDNDGIGIFYETSYNALIRNNTLIRNALKQGPTNPGFPVGAIYLSEAGSDSRVATNYNTTLDITGNYFEDNWSGVVLWENADRYCGSAANTSTGECTRVNPNVATAASCNPTNISNAPYYNDCRWKTQNVKVFGNTFKHTPANIGSGCSLNTSCGLNAVFSNYGTYPDWSPYTGTKVQNAITFNQGNVWSNNTYTGQWGFMPFDQGSPKTFTTWRAAPYNQDANSTMNSQTPPPSDTTAPTVSLTAPVNGATVSGTVALSATANDNVGVSRVDFYLDGALVNSDTTSSYSYNWNSTGVPNGTHTVLAKAYDAASNVGTSQSASVTVNNQTTPPTDTTPPSVPTNVTAVANSYNKVTVGWTASTDNVSTKGYYVVRNNTTIAQTASTSYIDLSVAPGTAYAYKVIAFDAANNASTASVAANVTTPAAPTAPSVPSNLSASAVSSTQINLAWTASTGNPSSYDIYRNSTKIASVASNITSFGDGSLSPSTSYSYYVIALNSVGSSSPSAAVSATTLNAPAPNPQLASLQGAVRNMKGAGLSRAKVSLYYSGANHTHFTNRAGYYYFRNVPVATYKVTYSAKQFKTQVVSIQLVQGTNIKSVSLIYNRVR